MKSSREDRRRSGCRNALQSYLQAIRRFQLLTESGEHRLATETQQGSEAARQALIESNLRLVVRIAMDYRHFGIAVEDLISEGSIGLIEAAKRFDATLGARFASYASWWIRKYMVAALDRQTSQSSTPAGVHLASSPNEAGLGEGAFSPRPGGAPPRASRQRLLSFEELLRPIDDRPLLDTLTTKTATDPEQLVLAQEHLEALSSILGRLPAEERRILEMHYGLAGRPHRTLHEIGNTLGFTRERVRQLEIRALRRARTLLHAGGMPLP